MLNFTSGKDGWDLLEPKPLFSNETSETITLDTPAETPSKE
jgi:hypothetical protein